MRSQLTVSRQVCAGTVTSRAIGTDPSALQTSLADVVEQVLAVLPEASPRTVVLAARHCRRELDIENAGAPLDLAAVTARTLARVRASWRGWGTRSGRSNGVQG